MQQKSSLDPDILILKAVVGHDGVEITLSQGRESLEESLVELSRASLGEIQKGAGDILSALRRINLHGGRIDSAESLKTLGNRWFEQLLGTGIRRRLREITGEFLLLELDASLSSLPWELLHDGSEFLGCRFSMGRHIVEWSSPASKPYRKEPLSCLILSNPTNDLGESFKEGHQLADLFGQDPRLRVEWFNSRITSNTVTEAFPRINLLHFSGHATAPSEGECGWLLEDGMYTAHALGLACEDSGAPILVFNNACYAAESSEPSNTGGSGLAEAFIKTGCEHYIGTLREVIDEGSRYFAAAFYRQVLTGAPVGLAVKQARLETRASRGPRDLTWAQYVLFGDPAVSLFGDGVAQTEVRTICLIEQCNEKGGAWNRLEVDIDETLSLFPDTERLVTDDDVCILAFRRPSEAVRFALLLAVRGRNSDPLGEGPPPYRVVVHEGEVTLHRERMGGSLHDITGHPFELTKLLPGIAQPYQILTSKPVFDNARAILRDSDIGAGIQVSWLDHGPYRLREWEEPIGICEVGAMGWAPLKAPSDSTFAWRHISPDQEPVLGWRPALDHEIPTSPGWLLVEKLGEGAFGEVWKACHMATSEFRVYKFCFRAERVRSLKREASLFQVLRHSVGDNPNIVRLYEVYFEEPPYFISMEYVPGKDLGAWFPEHGGGDLAHATRLEIAARIADVLQVAHDAGIIHRDIKPSNILIAEKSTDSATFEVKIGDFGIGRLESSESLISTPFGGFTETFAPTEMASHSGTRIYMAPELLVGKPASIRSDIYSLGVVLYQLIVGDLHRPLTADWRMDIQDPLLREDLEHSLAGDPSTRFSSASELARSLRALEVRRKDRTRKRFLSIFSVTFCVVFLVAVALGIVLYQVIEAKHKAEEELYISSIKLAEQAIEDYRFQQAYDLLLAAPEAFRNWEWGHLMFLCNQDLMAFRGHEGGVTSTVFGPQGVWLATGGVDGTLRIWDLQSEKELYCLRGSHGGVNALAISPDGNFLAAGCKGRAVEIWDTSRWVTIQVLEGFTDSVSSVAFAPDGQRLAAGSLDCTARVFNMATGEVLGIMTHGEDPIYATVFSPDGHYLSTCGGMGDPCDCSARVWETDTYQLIQRLPAQMQVRTSDFSPDGNLLAVAGMDEVVQIWDWHNSTLLRTLTGFTRLIPDLHFSPDGRYLAVCSLEGIVRIWNTEDWREERVSSGHTGGVNNIAIRSDGKALASAGADGTCRLWPVYSPGEDPFTVRHPIQVRGLSFNPDGNKLANCDVLDPMVTLLDTQTGLRSIQFEGFYQELIGMDFSPDGRWFAGGGNDCMVHMWDAKSGAVVKNLGGPLSRITSLQFSGDSKWLAGVDGDGTSWLWDTANWNEISCWQGAQTETRNVRWSPDGRNIASGQMMSKVSIWDPFSCTSIMTLMGHSHRVRAVAFSPDGQYIATGSDDATAILWDLTNGQRLVDFRAHTLFVLDIAFSEDGRRLFTASEDGTLKVWETESGRDLITLHGHTTIVQRLDYSPENNFLASADGDGLVHLWVAFPWHLSDYPGTGQESFEDRLETYKRHFWRQRYTHPSTENAPVKQEDNGVVTLSDAGFERAVRKHLSKPSGVLTRSDLKKVHSLVLGGEQIDLEGLRYCPDLYFLSISTPAVTHATYITELKSLRWLWLYQPVLSDFTFLKDCPHLNSLILIGGDPRVLKQISSVKSLVHVRLVRCQLENISPLSNLTNLAYLDVSHNLIQDLQPLHQLQNIFSLEAHHNRITDVSPVCGLKQVVSLILHNNPIRDCTPFEKLDQLRALDISSCSLVSIAPLSKLLKLRKLGIGKNRIHDLHPISNLTNLTALDISGVSLSDLGPLAALTGLRRLHLSPYPPPRPNSLDGVGWMMNIHKWAPLLPAREPILDGFGIKDQNKMEYLPQDLSPLLSVNWPPDMEIDLRGTPAIQESLEQISALKGKGVQVIVK